MLATAAAQGGTRTLRRADHRLALATLLALVGGLLLVAPVDADAHGSVTVNKFDAETGEPLADACFVLILQDSQEPFGEPQCTNAAGITTFAPVPAGDYLLFETQPPPGYAFIEEPTPVSVTDTAPSPVIDVPNVFEGPPPGFLEIDKFDCTGADGASLHVFENPPEPPSGFLELGECAIGQATFLLTGGDLPQAQPLETNLFGFAFTELSPGTYQLYETSPNQAGPVSFTVENGEFVFVAAINPLELPPGAPGPRGPAGPPGPRGPAGAAGGPTVGALPNTSTDVPVTGDPSVWLWAVGALGVLTTFRIWRSPRPG